MERWALINWALGAGLVLVSPLIGRHGDSPRASQRSILRRVTLQRVVNLSGLTEATWPLIYFLSSKLAVPFLSFSYLVYRFSESYL